MCLAIKVLLKCPFTYCLDFVSGLIRVPLLPFKNCLALCIYRPQKEEHAKPPTVDVHGPDEIGVTASRLVLCCSEVTFLNLFLHPGYCCCCQYCEHCQYYEYILSCSLTKYWSSSSNGKVYQGRFISTGLKVGLDDLTSLFQPE